ncbi:MAG: hypothetical protein KY476_12410 [Planctomycetes bacterium]|nr:hypothetical protein [Planctomycetota bacterium]
MRSRSLWLICGQQFLRAAGYIFYATWFPTFLIYAGAALCWALLPPAGRIPDEARNQESS